MNYNQILAIVFGIIAPFIIQGIKKYIGVAGKLAQWVAFSVCVVVAVGVMYFTGAFNSVDILSAVGLVFTAASLVFTQFFKTSLPDGSAVDLSNKNQ